MVSNQPFYQKCFMWTPHVICFSTLAFESRPSWPWKYENITEKMMVVTHRMPHFLPNSSEEAAPRAHQSTLGHCDTDLLIWNYIADIKIPMYIKRTGRLHKSRVLYVAYMYLLLLTIMPGIPTLNPWIVLWTFTKFNLTGGMTVRSHDISPWPNRLPNGSGRFT